MLKICKIASSLGFAVLSACGGSDPAQVPSPTPPLLPAESLARYGPHERQVADIYFPQDGATPIKGVAVWIHGGGWIGGNKDDSKTMVQPLTKEGVVIVNMNYRLNTEGAWPNSVEDVKTVLSALYTGNCESCDESSGLKRLAQLKHLPLFVGGSSAGGYLALMGGIEHLQTHPREGACVYNHVGPPDMRIHGVTNDFGRQLIETYSSGDVSVAKLAAMSPLVKMESGAWDSVSRSTKFLLSYGLADEFVPFSTTRGFTEELRKKGFSYTEVLYDFPRDGGHAVPDAVSRQDVNNAIRECFGQYGTFRPSFAAYSALPSQ